MIWSLEAVFNPWIPSILFRYCWPFSSGQICSWSSYLSVCVLMGVCVCLSILISHYSRREKAPYNVLHLLGDLRAWFPDTCNFTLKTVTWIQSSPSCKSIPLATALFSYLSTFDGSSSFLEQLHWVLASVCSTNSSDLFMKCIYTLNKNSIRALHHCFVCQNIHSFFFLFKLT